MPAVAHQLSTTAVTEKLKMMFGADSVANHKDLQRVQKALRGVAASDALTMEDEWDDWHDAYYEEEDEAYRNRATKESLATIKERVGKEKIEEMKSSRLKDDDPRKPLPKILEKQPSSVEIHDGT